MKPKLDCISSIIFIETILTVSRPESLPGILNLPTPNAKAVLPSPNDANVEVEQPWFMDYLFPRKETAISDTIVVNSLGRLVNKNFKPDKSVVFNVAACALKEEERVEILTYFKWKSLPLEIEDDDGNTLLHYAAYFVKGEKPFSDILKLLSKVNLLKDNKFGNTALHAAVEGDNHDAVHELLKQEPRLFSIANHKKHIAFEYALKIKNSKILESFKEFLGCSPLIDSIKHNGTLLLTAIAYDNSYGFQIINNFTLASPSSIKEPNIKDLVNMFQSQSINQELMQYNQYKDIIANKLGFSDVAQIASSNYICNYYPNYFVLLVSSNLIDLINPANYIFPAYQGFRKILNSAISFLSPVIVAPYSVNYCKDHLSIYFDHNIKSLKDAHKFLLYHNTDEDNSKWQYLLLPEKCSENTEQLSQFTEYGHQYALCQFKGVTDQLAYNGEL